MCSENKRSLAFNSGEFFCVCLLPFACCDDLFALLKISTRNSYVLLADIIVTFIRFEKCFSLQSIIQFFHSRSALWAFFGFLNNFFRRFAAFWHVKMFNEPAKERKKEQKTVHLKYFLRCSTLRMFRFSANSLFPVIFRLRCLFNCVHCGERDILN